MGHNPITKPKPVKSSPGGLRSGIIPSLLTSSASHINKLIIIAKGEEPHTRQPNKQQGKVEQKQFIMQSHVITQSKQYLSTNHVMTSQTIHQTQSRLIRITYNLVGFSECLHLWWISLLTPELSVTSGTMSQPPTHKVSP